MCSDNREPQSVLDIRLVAQDDIQLLAALCVTTFYETYCETDTPRDLSAYIYNHFSPEAILQNLKRPETWWFLAYCELKAIAYICLTTRNNSAHAMAGLQIERIYILERFQGRGFGRELLEHCMQFGRASGHSGLWLTVLAENSKAVKFYEKAGLKRTRDIVVPYSTIIETHYVYELGVT